MNIIRSFPIFIIIFLSSCSTYNIDLEKGDVTSKTFYYKKCDTLECNYLKNASDKEKIKLFAMAAYAGNIRVLSELLNLGVDVNAKLGILERTALHYAARGNRVESINFLLYHQAKKNVFDLWGLSPFSYGKYYHPDDNWDILVAPFTVCSIGDIDDFKISKLTEEYRESEEYKMYTVRKEIENRIFSNPSLGSYGIYLNFVQNYSTNQINLNNIFLDKYKFTRDIFNIDYIFKGWIDPLHLATVFRDIEGIRLLIKKEWNLNVQEKLWGNGILFYDNPKRTALHLAVECDYPEIVRLLLNEGADYKIKNGKKENVLESAKKLKRVSCIKVIEEYINTRGNK